MKPINKLNDNLNLNKENIKTDLIYNMEPFKKINIDINNIKIYIINETSREDRKLTMCQQMEHFNITNYEFFKACDKYNSYVYDDYCRFNRSRVYKNKIGVIGIIHSTLNLFKYINRTTEEDYVLIMEDDCFFNKDIKTLFNFTIDNENANVILLGYNLQSNKNLILDLKNEKKILLCINKYLNQSISFLGRYGYVCNRKYREMIIEKGTKWFLRKNIHIDYGYELLNKEFNEKIQYYIFGGDQLAAPYILDKNAVNYIKQNCDNWYENRLIDVRSYYNNITIDTV